MHVELMGPAAREEAGVRRERPRGGRARSIEPNPVLGQPLQVGSGRTPISIKAQAVTPDRIQHDEENVRGTSRRQGTTRFAPLLEPVFTKYRTRQQQDRSQKNGKSPDQERQSPFGRLRFEPGNQL